MAVTSQHETRLLSLEKANLKPLSLEKLKKIDRFSSPTQRLHLMW